LPESKLSALSGIALGPVVRVTLAFRERFWQNLKGKDGRPLSKLRFLFSHDRYFPTWWTTQPLESPLLVAWSPADSAEQLSGWNKDAIVAQALASLATILPVDKQELETLLQASFMHDWQADPFSHGAYSYLCVGAADACNELALPLGLRLHFAGEATDVHGDHATVHGAIASGQRAAREILNP
jgi:monoamine oxidase